MISIPECAAGLRHAVQSGQYDQVPEWVRRCEGEVRQAAESGMSRESVEPLIEALLWARRALRAARAHDAAELARCRSARPYHPPLAPPARCFQWEG